MCIKNSLSFFMKIYLRLNQQIMMIQYLLLYDYHLIYFYLIAINMHTIHKVVIIGAGISGLAASNTLSEAGINHLILQGRQRIGGRILQSYFKGIRIDEGASFVHSPSQNNQIDKLIKSLNGKMTSAQYEQTQSFYAQFGVLQQQKLKMGQKLYDQCITRITDRVYGVEDVSIQQASYCYQQMFNKENIQIRDIAKWHLLQYGNVQGAKLSQISAKSLQKLCLSEQDYLPQEGFVPILEHLFNKHKISIQFNSKVQKIDYSDRVIKVYTNNQEYLCQRVIISVPLGILKKKLIRFQPQLPQQHQMSINMIGFGILNKLFVEFQKPFWDISKRWLQFIGKKDHKYLIASTMSETILCFFISGTASFEFSNMSQQQIIKDIYDNLNVFKVAQNIAISGLHRTKWQEDNLSYGSYSFYQVGTTADHFLNLAKPINNRVWFIGQHCNPKEHGCVHSAYLTGLNAAKAITKEVNEQQFNLKKIK